MAVTNSHRAHFDLYNEKHKIHECFDHVFTLIQYMNGLGMHQLRTVYNQDLVTAANSNQPLALVSPNLNVVQSWHIILKTVSKQIEELITLHV